MKHITLLILSLLSFNAFAAPVGFADIEFTLKPPTERDYCLDPMGETEDSIAAKGIQCLEWQKLSSDEISHYEITRDGNVLVDNFPHVVGYIDFIFYDGVLPFGSHNMEAITYDTNGLFSKIKAFTINVVPPNGNPKSLMEFSAKQKPLP